MSENKKTIGILIGNMHTYFPRMILNKFKKNAEELGVNLVVITGFESNQFFIDDKEVHKDFDYQYLTAYEYADFLKLDALIVVYGSITTFQYIKSKDDFFSRFRVRPIISLEEIVNLKYGITMLMNNYQGIYDMTEHLIKVHGLKNILFITGSKTNQEAGERLHGYLDAMKSAGITVTDKMIGYGDYTEYVDDTVEKLLDDNPGAQGIVSSNDEMTRSVYRVCSKRHIKIGTDLAVTGFDNIILASKVNPPLTTVEQGINEITLKSLQAATDYEKWKNKKKIFYVPTIPIYRESCGCKYEDTYENSNANEQLNEETRREYMTLFNQSQMSYHKSLTGPFLLRELIDLAYHERKFFKRIAQEIRGVGARNSWLYLLAQPKNVRQSDDFVSPKNLRLTYVQHGDNITVYSLADRPELKEGKGTFACGGDSCGSEIYGILIFDGPRQYGMMFVDTSSDHLTDFYTLSIQIGIAIHFLEMTKKQNEYREELKEQNAMLNFSASYDELTGVLNRRGIIEQVIEYRRKNSGKFALVVMGDLDHLKEINDTFGHNEGDSAIKECALMLSNITNEDGFVGRIGGDEFVSLTPVADPASADALGDRMVQRLKTMLDVYNDHSEKPYFVEMSVGYSVIALKEDMDFSDIITAADSNLYEAKKSRPSSVIRRINLV